MYEIYYKKIDFLHSLKAVLVLMIAAIPVGMQTVLTVTMAVGAKQLAAKQVIVKRLTAIEELASVSILCSGKLPILRRKGRCLIVIYRQNRYHYSQ